MHTVRHPFRTLRRMHGLDDPNWGRDFSTLNQYEQAKLLKIAFRNRIRWVIASSVLSALLCWFGAASLLSNALAGSVLLAVGTLLAGGTMVFIDEVVLPCYSWRWRIQTTLHAPRS